MICNGSSEWYCKDNFIKKGLAVLKLKKVMEVVKLMKVIKVIESDQSNESNESKQNDPLKYESLIAGGLVFRSWFWCSV